MKLAKLAGAQGLASLCSAQNGSARIPNRTKRKRARASETVRRIPFGSTGAENPQRVPTTTAFVYVCVFVCACAHEEHYTIYLCAVVVNPFETFCTLKLLYENGFSIPCALPIPVALFLRITLYLYHFSSFSLSPTHNSTPGGGVLIIDTP